MVAEVPRRKHLRLERNRAVVEEAGNDVECCLTGSVRGAIPSKMERRVGVTVK
jgi:hypothetical protein